MLPVKGKFEAQKQCRYAVWITGTYRKKGARPAVVGDNLPLLREYTKEQRIPCEVRTIRTGEKM